MAMEMLQPSVTAERIVQYMIPGDVKHRRVVKTEAAMILPAEGDFPGQGLMSWRYDMRGIDSSMGVRSEKRLSLSREFALVSALSLLSLAFNSSAVRKNLVSNPRKIASI